MTFRHWGTGIETCPVLEAARRLTGEASGIPLPDDWEAVGEHDNQILAEIRHEYTNYEELLNELPLCVDLWMQIGGCPDNPWTWSQERLDALDGEKCLLAMQAHDTLKWTCRGIAESLLKQRSS